MMHKKGPIAFSILIVLGILCFFLFQVILQNQPQNESHAQKQTSIFSKLGAAIGIGKRTTQEESYAGSWEKWLDAQTEIIVEAGKKEGIQFSRDAVRKDLKVSVEKLKENLSSPPALRYDVTVAPGETKKTVKMLRTISPIKHLGPQTPEALMESFDTEYSRIHRDTGVVDEKYPRAEWIQLLLNKGITIEDSSAYSVYLNLRNNVVRLENAPAAWQSGNFGIPATDDWDIYRNAYIDRKHWEYQHVNAAMQADPSVTGGTFVGSDAQTFLPFNGKRVYVERFEDGATFLGTMISGAQKFEILHLGSEPEGLEVIYIDSKGNILSEAPPPITREEFLEKWGPPPPDSELSEEFTDWMQPERDADITPQYNSEKEGLDPTQQAAKDAKNLQKQFKMLQDEAVKQLTKSDTEIQAELEKQFLQELPSEENFQKALRQRFSPERFNTAMQTLNRYGPEEGLRRLKASDPEVAKYIERNTDSPE